MRLIILTLWLVALHPFSNVYANETDTKPALKVHFVNPGHQFENSTGLFWRNVSIAMEAVAADLDIQLTTSYANRNHILMKEQLLTALQSDADYLVVVDEKKAVTQLLKQIDKVNKPLLFIFNAPDDDVLIKKPKWLVGYIAPNNFDAGYKLARTLYNASLSRYSQDATINMFALYGDHLTDSAISRQHGLDLFLRQHPQVKLVHSDVANWSKSEGFRKSLGVLNHSKEINVIWAANDPIASGALLAARKVRPEDVPVVGGVNWDKIADNERAEISVGGHVLLGAAALIMLFDSHTDNKAFATDSNFEIFEPNNEEFHELIETMHNNELGKINFTRFSSTHPDTWQFSLQNLAKCLKEGC
ncbi:substrate-binding domain-containing protein [Pseudoalteromonas sp. YIC-656]|uniref:substrate-binding domain-containing protein n=1 Tax=Pseudoalteromonas pernae TaxID=3118054 RepID=UPI003242595D